MSAAARFTWLVAGWVAVTLILATAVSTAMNVGTFLPALAHRVAARSGGGGQDAVPGRATASPAPRPTAHVDQETTPGEDDRERQRGDAGISDGDGHGDDRGRGDGRDGGGR